MKRDLKEDLTQVSTLIFLFSFCTNTDHGIRSDQAAFSKPAGPQVVRTFDKFISVAL